MSLDDFARVPLMFGPSPVHPLRRLSAALGGKVEIWAKREGGKPYPIPAGASDHPLGGLGFANGSARHYAQP
jgi:1-aminocyclopropane-1-carboxylate deaminase/D-cysteine desulfhydrase-like pyridoxal-dependent ACC family enzyme